MNWFLAQLGKGAAFPPQVPWPGDIPAYIPLARELLAHPERQPPEAAVQLYWRTPDDGTCGPLAWLGPAGQVECALDLPRWLAEMGQESYRPEHRTPLTARLGFNYHRLPGVLRFAVIQAMLRLRRLGADKRQVFPVSFFNGGCEILLGVAQPGEPVPGGPLLVLTHDIETAQDFRWIEPICRVEEERGFRSCWNVIPRRYPLDRRLLARLLEQGHEIGLHGIWHDSREPFLGERAMAEQFELLTPLLREFAIQGYRSPAWFRTQRMFKVLAEFFVYDSSCLDNDLVCPAGYGGVGLMRPYRLPSGLVELPCTLPFEAPIYFGVEPENMLAYWRPKIDFIQRSRGLLLVNTHSDPQYGGNDRHLRAYAAMLEALAGQGWQARLPREVAAGVPPGAPR